MQKVIEYIGESARDEAEQWNGFGFAVDQEEIAQDRYYAVRARQCRSVQFLVS